ncbi:MULTISPECIES: hypothetical protein [unclassified Mesorhizobium]|uniref:hypothetical protein n=1 Tax=unclassified Mesorhizobium TaxID=325217 RepID=UPI001FEF97B3|nr:MULTISPECIES: hypothetical protein [unclassified Mesorhizobium]
MAEPDREHLEKPFLNSRLGQIEGLIKGKSCSRSRDRISRRVPPIGAGVTVGRVRQLKGSDISRTDRQVAPIWYARSSRKGCYGGLGIPLPGAHPATFEVSFVPLLPVFGKLGAKAPVAVIPVPVRTAGLAARLRQALASYGAKALQLSVVVWTVAILGAAFLFARG